jgi:hypothetical protein
MPRQFRAKNLSVNLNPSGKLAQLTDKLRLCVLHTHICLGWTHCRLFTHYCLAITWCRIFTCGWGSFNCNKYTFVACRLATGPDPCGAASWVVDPGDIVINPEIYVQQVAELRADLQAALKELDAHEKEIADVVEKTQG